MSKISKIIIKIKRRLRSRPFLLIAICTLLLIGPTIYVITRFAHPAKAEWYDEAWLYRRQLFFNNAASTTNLTDFPVLVTLNSSNFDFTQAKTGGEDLRFSDSNGTTLLSYEIELYDPTSQSARVWVKVPQINASSTTDSIFVYWGNSGATDAQSADDTWNSSYKGVYHLGDNTSTTAVTDSSGLGNTITASENTNNDFSQTGKIGNGLLTGGAHNFITKQDGQNLSELYPDIILDSSGYPVIAYFDATNTDLILVHCNDKECKGGDESVSVVDSTNATGYYPSIQLDSNGYPMIAYWYGTGADLKYVHCNDSNCTGGDETFSVIESTNATGYYPRMVKDANGYPVIAYYYSTGADVKLVHCGNADCSSGNQINNVDTTGTVGNGYHYIDLTLDSSGYPVLAYYDVTNTELKVAHCNDANCAGSNESLTSPLSSQSDSLGITPAIKLDGSGLPMIAYQNTTDTNLEFIHCDDVNCAGDEASSLKVIYTSTTDYPVIQLNTSGNPIIAARHAQNYPTIYACSDTNCTTNTTTVLSYYNQSNGTPSGFVLDSSNNYYVVSYARGRTNTWDTILYTTHHKLERAYDSDFNFGTGSFSVSAWFKSNGLVQQNTILSRYDSDQGFKFYLNYAGQPCFGIDDDSSWGPDDSACSSNPQIITNVDNGNAANVNNNVSIVLDSNGYPIIVYYDYAGTQLNLELIHCNDANCTGNNETYATLDSTGDVGTSFSLILDGSGYPVVAYHDNTNQDLKIIHCGNANCSSGNVINTVDSTGDVGDFPTVKLDASGYPVISYYDTTNTAVKLAHCNDVNCSGSNESITTLVNDEDDRVRNGSDSLQLDSSGYPMVVYTDVTNWDLEYIRCNDANCDGVGETKVTLDSTNSVGDFASIVLDASGYPVIIYQDGSNLKLKLIHCGNANCSSGNTTNTVNISDNGDYGYYDSNIILNPSGYPVISSFQPATNSLFLTVCNDVNCSGGDESVSMIRSSTITNYGNGFALDSNNYPVLAYAYNWSDIALIHLDNPTTFTETGNHDDDQWHHLVGVKNGTSSITLFLDGVAIATDSAIAATGTLTSDSASLNLAEEISNTLSLSNWTGYLDEVQLDTTARSSDWIKAQYLSESGNFLTSNPTEPGPAAVSLSTYSGTNRLKANLVAHYKFDEGYGTIAHNSGSGGSILNGTLDNAKWTTNGKYSKAINCELDNNNEEVDIGNSVSSESALSISAWINPESHTTTGGIIGEGAAYRLYVSTAGKLQFFIAGNPSNTNATLTSTDNVIVDGVWQHVAAVWDGSNATWGLYYNGKRIVDNGTANTVTSLDGVDSDNAAICNYWNNYASARFDGFIDEVKIYNAALTPDEIKLDYNHGSAMSLGSLSDTSALTGGSVASNSASAAYCVPGSSDPCSPPVGEWNFEEKTGTTTNDLSGNGNTISLSGTPQWSTGKIGSSLEFEGSPDTASFTDPGINGVNTLSIEFWLNNDSTNPSWTNPLSFGTGLFRFETGTNPATDLDLFNTGIDSSSIICTGCMTSNTWQHIAFTSNSSNWFLYINGVQKLTGTTDSTLTGSGTVYLGSRTGSSSWWKGKIDGLKIYNYYRTPAQIAWDYNQGKPIAHWKFDECSGATANDSSGNDNTGTITIGASGTNTSVGTCTGSAGEAWKDGIVGKYNSSLEFDGTDDYVQLTQASSPNPTANLTVSAWIKVSNLANSTNYNIFSKQTWGSKLGFRFSLGGYGGCANQNCLFLGVGDGVNQNETASTIYLTDIGNWHHVAATFSSGSLKYYIDGKLNNSTTTTVTSIVNDAVAARIGRQSTGNEYFPGQIDDVRIYNYALTPTQIKNVYNEGSAVRFGP